MHAGILGVVFYSIILGIIYSYIDNLRNYNIPNWVIICALINPIRIILLSADVLTAFLTHGLFLSLVFITLFRKSNKLITD